MLSIGLAIWAIIIFASGVYADDPYFIIGSAILAIVAIVGLIINII